VVKLVVAIDQAWPLPTDKLELFVFLRGDSVRFCLAASGRRVLGGRKV